jgi:hypothetical protein
MNKKVTMYITIVSLTLVSLVTIFILATYKNKKEVQQEKVPGKIETVKETDEQNPEEDEVVFCTQDVRRCPDGSFVGRVPPKCNFAPCKDPVNSE